MKSEPRLSSNFPAGTRPCFRRPGNHVARADALVVSTHYPQRPRVPQQESGPSPQGNSRRVQKKCHGERSRQGRRAAAAGDEGTAAAHGVHQDGYQRPRYECNLGTKPPGRADAAIAHARTDRREEATLCL